MGCQNVSDIGSSCALQRGLERDSQTRRSPYTGNAVLSQYLGLPIASGRKYGGGARPKQQKKPQC